jgi:hypothetical protein
VAPGDAAALAQAITAMIDRLPTFDRATIARDAHERFNPNYIGTMLYRLYESLIEDRHNRGRPSSAPNKT